MNDGPFGPSVSVVVPVYRSWRDAERLLTTLYEGEGDPWEYVVVDDASDDGEVDEFRRRLPWVLVAQRPRNGGFAAAVNTGMAGCTGRVLAVLNSDLIINRESLDRLITIVTHRGLAIAGPSTYTPGNALLPVARRPRTVWRVVADFSEPIVASPLLSRWLRDVDVSAQSSTQPTPVGWVAGSCLVFTREVLELIGPFDEQFYMDSEEVDWQSRARKHGVTVLYVPDAHAVHDVGHGIAADGERANRRYLWAWRARLAYVRKHHGALGVAMLRLGLWMAFISSFPSWIRRLRSAGQDEIVQDVRRRWAVLVGSR